jgi:sugar phosphate permease
VYGYSKAQAGQILSMLAIGMIVGSPLLSYASTSLLQSRKKVIIFSSIMVLLLTACLAFLTDRIPMGGHYALCFGLGVFSSAIVVIGFTTNKELFPVQIAGTATGLVNFFPFAGGAVFQPILGYVLEQQGKVGGAFTLQGYQQAFLVLFLCGVIALIASFFIRETLE